MVQPTNKKEVQSLTRRVAVLNCFISQSTDRCLPFFKAIQGARCHINWTEECDEAFRKLKTHMGPAPILFKPEADETLGIYLSVSVCSIRSVLTREADTVQQAVYYRSKNTLSPHRETRASLGSNSPTLAALLPSPSYLDHHQPAVSIALRCRGNSSNGT